MATIQIEGHLTGPEDEDTGIYKWLELDEESLARLLISKLDGKRSWTTYDYGHCRITIEQLDMPEDMAERTLGRRLESSTVVAWGHVQNPGPPQ